MLERLLPILLIFKYFSQNAFSLCSVFWLCVILNGHAATMDCVKLSLNINTSRRPLACRIRIPLSNRRSLNLNICSWSGYQILSLVAAWLNHQALVLIATNYLRSIDRLPSVLVVCRSSVSRRLISLVCLLAH